MIDPRDQKKNEAEVQDTQLEDLSGGVINHDEPIRLVPPVVRRKYSFD